MEWNVPSTLAEPDIYLASWAVMEFSMGRFIFGETPDLDGRRSTKVVSVEDDDNGSVLITKSGRRYHLYGPPGLKGNGSYMFNSFAHLESTDVSEEYKWS